jgi:glycosyltransferase involved in cell wall biosynthesis
VTEKMKILYIKGGRAIEEAGRLFYRIGELPAGGPDKFLLAVLYYSRTKILRLASFGPETKRTKIEGRDVIEYGAYSTDKSVLSRRLKYIRSIISFSLDTLRFKPMQILCGVNGPFAIFVWLVARLTQAKFTFCAHNALALPSLSLLYRMSNRFLCKYSDIIIAHGPYVSNEAMSLGGKKDSVIEFNNGLDYEHEALINALPQKNGVKRDNFLILYVGRLEINKGVIDLFSAFNKLPSDKNINLCFIGEGGSASVLANLIRDHQLSDRVTILGQIPYEDVFLHLNMASVVVTPSQSKFPEGFCKSAMEALYVGTPVIAPNYGPFPFIIKHEVNGLLYEPDDIISLYKSLNRIISDKDLLDRLEKSARESGCALIKPATSFSDAIERVLC